MQGIATTIRLVDQMTAPIMSINNAINNLITGFDNVENASDIDTASSFIQYTSFDANSVIGVVKSGERMIILIDMIKLIEAENNKEIVN